VRGFIYSGTSDSSDAFRPGHVQHSVHVVIMRRPRCGTFLHALLEQEWY